MVRCSAKWIAILIASALSVVVACTPEPSRQAFERELLEADRAFLQATIEDGLEGWLSFFTDDALRVDLQGQETIVGLEAIRAADAALFEPGGLRLRWEPAEAFAFTGNKGGMTSGRYTLLDAGDDDGQPRIVGEGTYMTLWRREDGRLKIYLDTGAPDAPPEALLN